MKTQGHYPSDKSSGTDFNQHHTPRIAKGIYCISTGNKTLYHITRQQLKKLYSQLHRLPEQLSKASGSESPEDHQIVLIQKNTVIYEDEPTLSTFYYVYSKNCEIQMATFSEIQEISEMLHSFLDHCQQPANHIPETQPDTNYPIQIRKDPSHRERVLTFKSAININKRLSLSSGDLHPENHYMISINEQSSDWLTTAQLISFYQELSKFLKDKITD